MDLPATLANADDLLRLRYLEWRGVFARGFTDEAAKRVAAYVERMVWLVVIRTLPGAQLYVGPRVIIDTLRPVEHLPEDADCF